jgi:heme-degrading monooxygenase HmoA
MIKEVAMLNVIQGKEPEFENDFRIAGQYISAIPGYIRHTLSRCLEQQNKYLLTVEWKTLEDHTLGFRQSSEYLQWKQLLHHYYNPFPTVEHYVTIVTS